MNRSQKQPQEGNVVSSQSKVEQAKYVHTENNLRKTLSNINESFRRTNKRLSEETETLREELNKMRQNVEKIRQEKERRMTGLKCPNSSRRLHRAERLLYDENCMVKLEPFKDCQKFVCQRKPQKAKKKYLRLHGNRTSDQELGDKNKEEQGHWKFSGILPAIETENKSSETTISNKLERNKVPLVDVSYNKDATVKQRSTRYLNIGAGEVKPCSLKEIACKPHFLPPLERISEDPEPKAGFSDRCIRL